MHLDAHSHKCESILKVNYRGRYTKSYFVHKWMDCEFLWFQSLLDERIVNSSPLLFLISQNEGHISIS